MTIDRKIILELLEKAEWSKHDKWEDSYCFECGEYGPGPHKSDCKLDAAIKALRENEPKP
jgi:hypothetical protein